VTDVATANVLALTSKRAISGPLNICSGTPRSILEMAEAIRPAGAPHPVVVGGYRLGDVRHVFASPDRAVELLGFRAAVGFEEGVRAFATASLRSVVEPSLARTTHA
jgi:dTDP-L-rhamnose 4-epimerase